MEMSMGAFADMVIERFIIWDCTNVYSSYIEIRTIDKSQIDFGNTEVARYTRELLYFPHVGLKSKS